jgi:ammonium transporter Rh
MSGRALIIVGVTLEVIIIGLYGVFVRFDDYARMENNTNEKNAEGLEDFVLHYPMMQDVHVMMFIGFGFLMTFLKHHSWTGVSINFIAAALAIQLYILFEGFWHKVSEGDFSDTINISTSLFIRADYCAAAVLISFGGVIGKINTAQTLVMTTIEVFIYALQEMIVFEKIKAFDAGGSISIHTYGAYFGLMFSLIFSPKTVIGNPYNDSSYNSNLFAMIGTIFLWMHWPSFNAGIVTDTAGIHRAVVNTILSLTGSCVSTFILSALYNQGKFHMEDILNATLAGGVAIGAACDLIVYPFVSLLCGFLAGIISTIGYKRITRFLEHKIGLFDTAGIHNLHGMPGFLGGILSAIVVSGLGVTQWEIETGDYAIDGFYKQGGLQIAATFISLGFGLVGGAITGFTLKFVPLGQTQYLFQDQPYWIKCDPDPYEQLKVQVLNDRKKKKKVVSSDDESWSSPIGKHKTPQNDSDSYN